MTPENLPLITEETYTPELSALGYAIGDVMPLPEVLGEEDYTIDEAFLELNPEIVGDPNFELGTVIKRPIIGAIPPKPIDGTNSLPEAPADDATVPEAAAPENVTAPDEAPEVAAAPVGPVKMFDGQEVLSEGTREVNGITYRTIRTMNGSMFDLTEEQYALEVTVKES